MTGRPTVVGFVGNGADCRVLVVVCGRAVLQLRFDPKQGGEMAVAERTETEMQADPEAL